MPGVRLAPEGIQRSHTNATSSHLGSQRRSSNELAMLLRSAVDREGRGNNRLSKIECKRGDSDVPFCITKSKTRL